MNEKKYIFSFPSNADGKFFPRENSLPTTQAGENVKKFSLGKTLISTRICGKTENFQDFIRLEKSVSVLQNIYNIRRKLIYNITLVIRISLSLSWIVGVIDTTHCHGQGNCQTVYRVPLQIFNGEES